MDLGKFLDGLNVDTKSLIITLCLNFPLAFVDCWKLDPDFRGIDSLPQVVLACGIAVVFTIGGATFDTICRGIYGITQIDLDILPWVTPFAFVTVLVVLGAVSHPYGFLFAVIGFCVCFFGFALLRHMINRRKYNRETEKNDAKEEKGE